MNNFQGPNGEIVSSNGSEAGDSFLASYILISNTYQQNEAKWIEQLKKLGIKAAHPDDGWVNRVDNFVHLEYPRFKENNIEVDDLIALGSFEKWRVVRVTEIIPWRFILGNQKLVNYKFIQVYEVIEKGY